MVTTPVSGSSASHSTHAATSTSASLPVAWSAPDEGVSAQVELAMLSLMWSEHCSYKHSRRLLKLLPTSGPRVLQGPGENAGVVDIGDDWCIAFKVESHNHPSFIEPFQGAATGVGGIIRGSRYVLSALVSDIEAAAVDIAWHQVPAAKLPAGTYRVAMIGFAPGFPYLSGLDPALAVARSSAIRRSSSAIGFSNSR